MTCVKKAIQLIIRHWDIPVLVFLTASIIGAAVWARESRIPDAASPARSQAIQTAQQYLGYNEADSTHQVIVDIYNSQSPLPRDYPLTYEDSWCACFISTVSILCDTTDILPTECSCGQMITLFQQLGRWTETDWYRPNPGDIIFYDWNAAEQGDCAGWPEHVGMVTQVFGPVIKVIEGNRNDCVCYRYVFIDDPQIRGYGLPEYPQ